MKLTGISFTKQGAMLLSRMKIELEAKEADTCMKAYGTEKHIGDSGLLPLPLGLFDFVGDVWEQTEGFLFIGAAGIAVRAISPHLQGKTKDPAVVVIDEKGEYVIPLLSGHIGGANQLATMLAGLLQAKPVITTATDIRGKFAVDVFAKANGLAISDMELAKYVSAGILHGEQIGFYCDEQVEGELPEGLYMISYEEGHAVRIGLGIYIGIYENRHPFHKTLHLIPKAVCMGIGCKKGTPLELIEEQVKEILWRNKLSILSVMQLASIDLKKEEKGILDFCDKYGLKFITYTNEELLEAKGTFTDSEFVESITGVGNVCERAAVLSGGTLLQKKTSAHGITLALAVKSFTVAF